MQKCPPIKIAPSILAADCANLQSNIQKLSDAAHMLHFDVMDGHFVPNLTFGPATCAAVHKITPLPLDVHLMLTHPLGFIKPFADAGASIITFHIESENNPNEVISEIKKCGIKCGIALRPHTDLSTILPYLSELDMVLQMTVEPGFGGQSLDRAGMNNIRRLRDIFEGDIQVDGGVTTQNVRELTDIGANVIVAGTAIFGAPVPEAAARDLYNIATN